MMLTGLSALVLPAFAASTWSMDLPASMEKAVQEKKSVLVDFNGSDWCAPCQMLRANIFDTPEFAAYAKDKLVLVDVDLPNGDRITEAQKKINRALVRVYNVQGYPTVLILNKDGYVVGGFYGSLTDMKEVKKAIDAALSNVAAFDAAIDEAKPLSGQAKADCLLKSYQLVPEDLQANNKQLKELIMAHDATDASGFKSADKAAGQKEKDEDEAANFVSKLQDDLRNQHLAAIDRELQRKEKSKAYKVALYWAKYDVLLEEFFMAEDEDAEKLSKKKIEKAMKALKAMSPKDYQSIMDDLNEL